MMPVFVVTPQDVLVAVLFLSLGLVILAIGARRGFRQWLCKHDGSIYETMACDAICNKCHKNLGFIGTWRKRAAASRTTPDKEGT